ncbi:MAG: hypothetical protein AAFY41_10970, partial [Bacteroidota bacterium]
MRSLFTVLLTATIFLATGQKKTIDLEEFRELSLGIPANLYLKQGNTESIEIECDDDIYDKIEFRLSG